MLYIQLYSISILLHVCVDEVVDNMKASKAEVNNQVVWPYAKTDNEEYYTDVYYAGCLADCHYNLVLVY